MLVAALLATSSAYSPTTLRSAVNRANVVAQVSPVLPQLYVYDHCPFCVRVRLALGLLDQKHQLMFLANDDIETPTELIGKKIAPIWVDKDGPMMESLDIIAKVDTAGKFYL